MMDQQASWNETLTYLMWFSADVPTLCKTISFTRWPGIPFCVPQLLTRALFNSFIHSIPFHQALLVFSGKTAKQHASSQISMWRPIRDHLFGTTAIFSSLLQLAAYPSGTFLCQISPPPSVTNLNTRRKAPQRMCAMHEWQKKIKSTLQTILVGEVVKKHGIHVHQICIIDNINIYQHNYYNTHNCNMSIYTHCISNVPVI